MENQIVLKPVVQDNGTITILTGKALTPEAVKSVTIKCSDIKSVYEYLEKGVLNTLFHACDCIITVNKEEISMGLAIHQTTEHPSHIYGKIEIEPDLDQFHINTGNNWNPFKLADIIRQNKGLFHDNEFVNLVKQLTSIEAKVQTNVDAKVQLTSANKRMLVEQIVSSNLPASFKLIVPIFKNTDPVELVVEIYYNPDNSCIILNCPELKTIRKNKAADILNDICLEINQKFANIPIIYT